MGGGHFSRLEYASGGGLPGSLIGEFAHIAREYVNTIKREGISNQIVDKQPHILTKSPTGTSRSLGRTGQPPCENSISHILDPSPNVESAQVSTDPYLTPNLSAINREQVPENLLFDGDASLPIDDALFFPINDGYFEMDDEVPLGTDIMDLFNSAMPGIDPYYNPMIGGDPQD